jgi:hypothetical protein
MFDGEIAMSHLLTLLRSGALAAATLFLASTPFVTGSATVAAVTAVTVMTSSPAEAERARVRDHRKPCPPYKRGCPPYPQY